MDSGSLTLLPCASSIDKASSAWLTPLPGIRMSVSVVSLPFSVGNISVSSSSVRGRGCSGATSIGLPFEL